MPKAGRHIRALDGLRGLAILPVVAYHYIGWNIPEVGTSSGAETLHMLVEPGAKGVTLFFALSGYLITGILLDAKGKPGWLGSFLARRSLRIFPVYYLALAAIFFVAPLFLGRSAHELYGQVSDRQGWLWLYAGNLRIAAENKWSWCSATPCADGIDLNHFWSLAVEEHFYLVWPLLVWLFPRRALAWLAGGLSLGAVVLRLALEAMPGHRGAMAAMVFTPCRLDALLLGALPAILLREPDLRPAILRWSPALLLAPALAMLLPSGPLHEAIFPALISLAFAALVLVAAHAKPGGLLDRALGCAPLVFFGRISYGLYVVHAPLDRAWAAILSPASLARATHSPVAGLLLFFLFGLALSSAVAAASFYLFEKRFLALKDRFPTAREVSAPI